MSGRKRSEFFLLQERAEKIRTLQDINNLYSEVNALKQQIDQIIAGASQGLRSTFDKDITAAQNWLNHAVIPEVKGLDMQTALTSLNATKSGLEQATLAGRKLQESLIIDFTQKADEMGKRLAKHLADVERIYLSSQQLLELWFADGQMREWQDSLVKAKELMSKEQYTLLQDMLGATEGDIKAKREYAMLQEDKHQKRLYLLKSLRQVCADMGFTEISSPKYEVEGHRDSRINFSVDTHDRGKIEFNLSLDGIRSFSEIARESCDEDFGKISKFLKDKFGIHTKFDLEEGGQSPN